MTTTHLPEPRIPVFDAFWGAIHRFGNRKNHVTPQQQSEIQRRNRYWFEHFLDFTTEVAISEPVERSGYVGVSQGQFFGAAPIPYNSQTTDRGTFRIDENGLVWVLASRKTYCWNLRESIHVGVFPNGQGVTMAVPNQPVVTILGPVAAPLAGAFTALGYPVTLP